MQLVSPRALNCCRYLQQLHAHSSITHHQDAAVVQVDCLPPAVVHALALARRRSHLYRCPTSHRQVAPNLGACAEQVVACLIVQLHEAALHKKVKALAGWHAALSRHSFTWEASHASQPPSVTRTVCARPTHRASMLNTCAVPSLAMHGYRRPRACLSQDKPGYLTMGRFGCGATYWVRSTLRHVHPDKDPLKEKKFPTDIPTPHLQPPPCHG
jgi:hypothetical protein